MSTHNIHFYRELTIFCFWTIISVFLQFHILYLVCPLAAARCKGLNWSSLETFRLAPLSINNLKQSENQRWPKLYHTLKMTNVASIFIVQRHIFSSNMEFTDIKACSNIWVMSWNLIMLYVNNKDADQPAHLCSLISAFIFRLDYIISIDTFLKISRL